MSIAKRLLEEELERQEKERYTGHECTCCGMPEAPKEDDLCGDCAERLDKAMAE